MDKVETNEIEVIWWKAHDWKQTVNIHGEILWGKKCTDETNSKQKIENSSSLSVSGLKEKIDLHNSMVSYMSLTV